MSFLYDLVGSALVPSEYHRKLRRSGVSPDKQYTTSHLTAGKTASVDVCVVGGGLAGLSVAVSLLERGLSVAVVEATTIGAGASGRNGGMAIAGFAPNESDWVGAFHQRRSFLASFFSPSPTDEDGFPVVTEDARRLFGLSIAAKDLLLRRIAKYSIDADVQHSPTVYCSLFPDRLEDAAAEVDWANAKLGAHRRLLTAAELSSMVFKGRSGAEFDRVRSLASHPYCFGVLEPDSFALNPLKLCLGLARVITRHQFSPASREESLWWFSKLAGASRLDALQEGYEPFEQPVRGFIYERHLARLIRPNVSATAASGARRLEVLMVLPTDAPVVQPSPSQFRGAPEPDEPSPAPPSQFAQIVQKVWRPSLWFNPRAVTLDPGMGSILCDHVVTATSFNDLMLPPNSRHSMGRVWTWALTTDRADGDSLFGTATRPSFVSLLLSKLAKVTGRGARTSTPEPSSYCICDDRNVFSWYRALPDGRLLWGALCGDADKKNPNETVKSLLADMKVSFPGLADDVSSRVVNPPKLRQRDLRYRPDALAEVSPLLDNRVPSDGVAAVWGGIMAYTSNMMPVFGIARGVGMNGPMCLHASGFGGHGLVPTTMTGELLADIITCKDPRDQVGKAVATFTMRVQAAFQPFKMRYKWVRQMGVRYELLRNDLLDRWSLRKARFGDHLFPSSQ